MKEKKNIDRLFQEKFKDFEKSPQEDMWNRISEELDKKEKPSRALIIPLWLKVGSVAAILAIILSTVLLQQNSNTPEKTEPGIVYDEAESETNQEQPANEQAVPGEENNTQIGNMPGDSAKSATGNHATSLAEEHSENSEAVGNTSRQSTSSESRTGGTDNTSARTNHQIAAANTSEENSEKNERTQSADLTGSRVANTTTSTENFEKEKSSNMPEPGPEKKSGIIAEAQNSKNELIQDSIASEELLKEPESLIAENEEDPLPEEDLEEDLSEATKKKFQLSTFAAPIFYKNLGSGNELANQFSSNSKTSDVTVSVGMKLAYQVSKKIKIRTGVSKLSVNNNIEGIAFSPSALMNQVENISPSGSGDNINIINAPAPNRTGPASETNSSSFGSMYSLASNTIYNPGEIHQEFGFIEIPLELEYALLDKRFNLNLIGGASGLFLDDNRVSLVTETASTELGEASNINKTSFSTNVGIGLDYELNQNFSIGVEPIFKYQLNTFSNVNNVQPVNFGIYSGLSIRF